MAGVPPQGAGGYSGPPYAGSPYAGSPYSGPPGRGADGAYLPTPRFEPFGGLAAAATALLGVMAVLALIGLGA